MTSVQELLDKYPHAQECVNQAIGFFEHNNIPLYDLQWNENTQRSSLTMKPLETISVFKKFVHGGYSLGVLDAIGAFTGLLSVIKEGYQCLTVRASADFYKTIDVDSEILIITSISKEPGSQDTLNAHIDITQMGILCIRGTLRLKKIRLIH